MWMRRYKDLETGGLFKLIELSKCSQVYILEHMKSKKRRFVRASDLRQKYIVVNVDGH